MGEMRHRCKRLLIFWLKHVHDALSIQVRISRSHQTKHQIPCLCRMTPFCSCQNVMNVSEITADGLRLTALTIWLSNYQLLDILPDFYVKTSDLPPLNQEQPVAGTAFCYYLSSWPVFNLLSLLLLLLPVYFTCCIYLHPTGIFHTSACFFFVFNMLCEWSHCRKWIAHQANALIDPLVCTKQLQQKVFGQPWLLYCCCKFVLYVINKQDYAVFIPSWRPTSLPILLLTAVWVSWDAPRAKSVFWCFLFIFSCFQSSCSV